MGARPRHGARPDRTDRRQSVSARCTSAASGIAMGKHEPRHPVGQRRLADALRAADQPGVRNAPAAIGVQQRRSRPRDARTARWFRADAAPRSRGRPERALMRCRAAGWRRNRRSRKRGPYAGRDRIGIGVGIDQHAALRLVGCDLPVGVAQFPVKLDVFGLEAVGRAAAAAGGRALHAYLDGHIEDDGQVRLEIADGDPLHRIENRRAARCPSLTLIGPGRIRETVAQHPVPWLERRLDHGADMVVAGRRKQQRLGVRPQQLAHPGQHEMADDLGARRSAGLARDDGAQFRGIETLARAS